jgi:hypothetical protein
VIGDNYVKKVRSQNPSLPPRYYQPAIDDKTGHQVQVDPGETKVRRDNGSLQF